MRVFVYVLKHDVGFAPNPFHEWCTLACCKPAIRRVARPGDWVVGLTPAADGNRLAYAMKVDETLSFEEYWREPRFKVKRPRWRRGASPREKCGDNCYEPLDDGQFRQLWSWHFDRERGQEDESAKAKDLRGEKVLVGRRFCYYGAGATALPPHLTFKRPARFNRVISTDPERAALLGHLEGLPNGIQSRPRRWPSSDGSWQNGNRACG